MKVGVGITTYNRPKYLAQCLDSVQEHLLDVVDTIWVYNDGSKEDYGPVVAGLHPKIKYAHPAKNKGVAHAKNWLLKQLLKEGCDYIFLLEDDIIIKSPKAVTGYIEKSKESGIEHFLFAHHGTANVGKLALSENGVDLYTACIGAWCMYTGQVIEQVGLMDEIFMNAWEHVEHTHRVQKSGLTTPYPYYPDLTNSRDYLEEIPGSIESSAIRPRKDWMANIINGLIYWRSKSKDFPLGHILDSLLEEEDEQYQRLGRPSQRRSP